MPKSLTVTLFPSESKPKIICSMRRLKSSMSFERQKTAIISLAGVISKPDSITTPLPSPSPVTTCLKFRSFTSKTRFHKTFLIAFGVP